MSSSTIDTFFKITKILKILLLDMGTAEVVRAHTAQDTPCGIGRSLFPQDRSILPPKSSHILLKL